MSLSVKMLNQMNTIKAKDTNTEIKMQLIDGNGLSFDLTGASVKLVVGSKTAKIFEQAGTLGSSKGEVKFKLPSSVTAGLGKVYAEVVVTIAGETKTFPSNGFITMNIQNNLTATGVIFKATGS